MSTHGITSLIGLTETRRTPGVSFIVHAVSRSASRAVALAAWPVAKGGTWYSIIKEKKRLCRYYIESYYIALHHFVIHQVLLLCTVSHCVVSFINEIKHLFLLPR